MTPDTDKRIPITVVAGFLGAGKTTLVNHLIRTSGKRLGIIVNEFGKVGIDGGLIETVLDTPDDVQELTAGCLCCSGREDLLRALVLLAMRAEQEKSAPGHILIELSGVADPVPVLHTLLDPEVRQVFRIDGLVTVADARNLTQTMTENPEAALQLAYASAVVLNKTDLVAPQQLELSRKLVLGLQPLTRVLEAKHGEVDAGALLGLHDFSPGWKPPPVATTHTPGLKSFTLEAGAPLSLPAWYSFINRVVTRPGQVLRVKGHVCLQAHPQKLLVHAVRDVISVDATDAPNDGQTRLVMIGRDLVPAQEREAFAALLAAPLNQVLQESL